MSTGYTCCICRRWPQAHGDSFGFGIREAAKMNTLRMWSILSWIALPTVMHRGY